MTLCTDDDMEAACENNQISVYILIKYIKHLGAPHGALYKAVLPFKLTEEVRPPSFPGKN